MSVHTPGPWRVAVPQTVYEAKGGEWITSPNGKVCRCESRRFKPDLSSEAISEAERKANASLISAAPDLFEASQEALALIVNWVCTSEPEQLEHLSEYRAVIKTLSAAIHKATLTDKGVSV